MTYDWTAKAADGGGESEKMGNGRHHAEIIKLVFGKKNKPTFRSRNGAPQIMVVFGNPEEEEVPSMFTLSKAAAWTMARLLSCFGVDTDALREDGIEPVHFADPAFANSVLVGCKGMIEVVNDDDGGYPEVTPVHMDATDSAESPYQQTETYISDGSDGPHVPIKEEDIPF